METNYSLNSNTPATGLLFQAVQPVQSDFERQEKIMKEFIATINAKAVAFIAQSFNEAETEIERQAIIEGAQELGYYELALDLML